jgi:hypothetical protein
MHPRRSISIVAVIGLALVLAACSSAGASATAPGTSPAVAPGQTAVAPGQTAAAPVAGDGSAGLGEPVQLTFDPCTLITQDEAKAALGIDVSPLSTDNGGGGTCNYLGVGSPSHLLASLPSVADCKLLYLQIDRNLFNDVQTRIDGVGDGGMLVVGEGNLQIAVHHGCFELDGATADGPLPDATMLGLARTAVARVP